MKNFKIELNNLTPERIIFLIPLFVTFILLIPTFFYVTKPLFEETFKRRNTIKIMKEKIESIPIYKQSLKTQEKKLALVNLKREKILSIVIGSKSLETFLSEISDIALRNNILIRKIKKIELQNNTDTKKTPIDPFIIENSKKQLSEVIIEGNYNDITRFIKEAENLENLVLFKNFTLKVNRNNNRILNKLEVIMTVYGKMK